MTELFSVLRVDNVDPILLPRYRRLEHATRVDSDDGRYRMQKCDKDYDDGSVIYAALKELQLYFCSVYYYVTIHYLFLFPVTSNKNFDWFYYYIGTSYIAINSSQRTT